MDYQYLLLLLDVFAIASALGPRRVALRRRPLRVRSGINWQSLPRRRGRRRLEATTVVQESAVRGDVGGLGYYEVPVSLGTPPQEFSLIVDTGSVVTAVPCHGCVSCGVPGRHRQFDAARSATAWLVECDDDDACPASSRASGGGFARCAAATSPSSGKPLCRMEQRYTEGSRIVGLYTSDVACVGAGGCGAAAAARISFGCASEVTKLFQTQRADGILGLGRHPQTLVAALAAQHRGRARDAFALCFGRRGGHLTLGGLGGLNGGGGGATVWTGLVRGGGAPPTQYSVAIEQLVLGGGDVGAASRTFGAVLVDTGTTFTYVSGVVFGLLTSALGQFCARPGACVAARASSTLADVGSLGCFDFAAARAAGTFDMALASFPNLTLVLRGGGALCITAQQYTFDVSGVSGVSGGGGGVRCIGIYRDDARTVIGVNLLTGFSVKFDRERERLGFARSSCGDAVATRTPQQQLLPPFAQCDARELSTATFGWSLSLTTRVMLLVSGRVPQLLVALFVALGVCVVLVRCCVCCASEEWQERCDDVRDLKEAVCPRRGRAAVRVAEEEEEEEEEEEGIELVRTGALRSSGRGRRRSDDSAPLL